VEGELCLLEMPGVIRCLLLYSLEVLEMLDVMDVIRRVLLSMLEAVEGDLCSLEVPEVIRCVPLCMLEDVEGGSVCWRFWRH